VGDRVLRGCRVADDGAGVAAEQEAEVVFGLLDLLLQGGDLGLRGVIQFFGLADVGEGVGAAVIEGVGEVERLLASGEGLLRDGQLGVERAQLVVVGGHALDERGVGGLLRPLGGAIFGALGFGHAAILAPEVKTPCSGCGEATAVEVLPTVVAGGAAAATAAAIVVVRQAAEETTGNRDRVVTCASGQRRKLAGAGDADGSLFFQHAVGGNLDVVVVLQGFRDEGLQGGVREDSLPLLRAQGRGFRRCGRGDVGGEAAAVVGRCGHDRALVVGAYLAAGDAEDHGQSGERSCNPTHALRWHLCCPTHAR
jgi:hypothetical protein